MGAPRFKLLRFGLANFTSFREYTEVSFVSTSQKDSPQFRLQSKYAKHGVLPAMGVYGANAAGKSNLLHGLRVIRAHVLRSFGLRPEQNIPWQPWRMQEHEGAEPTRMDIDFEIEGVRFHYGFVHDAREFREEWLHRFKSQRPQVLFERNSAEANPWYFGASLKGEKSTIAKLTKSNTLFVSSAAQNNHPLLSKVFEALTQGIHGESFVGLRGNPVFYEGDPILDAKHRETVVKVLKAFDLGCIGFRAEKAPESSSREMLTELFKPEALEKIRQAEAERRPAFRILLEREDEGGARWTLQPKHESRGTQVLLQRINDLLSLESGVFVIDEIDTSLHPDVAAAIVGLFTASDSNLRAVQLFFATHDRSLLQHLRRDEIVVVEKNKSGESSLSVASDYKELRGRDDLRDVYEQGRLGGVPILGDFPPLRAINGG